MNSSHELLLTALIATFAIFHLVQAQEQEGFISLDCGLAPTEPSPYTEPVTTLQYSSDSNFIQSGKLGRIDTSLQTFFLKQQTTLRYFPDGIRNCYNLTVKQGTNYLIRARFTYGNYDGRNMSPTFDLYLGPNLWKRIDMTKLQNKVSTLEEITYIPLSNSLDVCLVKTNTTIPFISALELRPLPSNSYITTAGSLRTFVRFCFSNSVEDIRFPMDVHDRMWGSYFEDDWTQISTSLTVNTSDSFRLPQAALITAATPAKDGPSYIGITFYTSSEERFFIYLHFSEVQALRANETREFNISINGESVADLYRPLSRTQSSTHPPMINAIEIFLVSELLQSETYENDVIAIKKIKDTYGLQLISWQGDPCVPRLYKWDGLDCTDTDTYIAPRITSLKLYSKGLTGTIAADIQHLTSLEKLDLSDNKLVGVVPEFLANMKSLMFINLTKNDLHGSIPQALRDREKKGLKILFDGDKNDPCLSTSCNPKKKLSVMIVAIVASTVVFVLVVSLALFFGLRKKKTSSHVKAIPPSPTTPLENVMSTSISETSIEMKRKKFSYSEVMKMTNNFQRALGEGGFGTVYHGDLDSSQQVAVKLLSQSSTQGYKEFKAEVDLLLRVHHINLLNLVGYCDERDHLALIYEYMSNGDLKHHLSGEHGGSVLSWNIRLRIAVDAALGLEYLHIGCRPSMVHRDVKSTNILLDENFMAKIADFGLSRSFQLGGESHVSTVVAGSLGYLDPEYYRTSRLAEMSDVYSFGIVLLEIITNQRVIDQTREKPHITEWTAFMLNRGDITRIMDPNLNGDYNSHSVWRALELAMSCANPSSENRPSMSQVVAELKECLISENSLRSKNQDMSSQRSLDMSMNFDTKDVPSAR
ncbi:Protein kinase domain [Arabidopsis suecica]|uniref:non-specific serine/threonine protein kinase n=1 Tax=Arabidopsis suecica TaxID=45249 RepID=A0A8T2FDJ8_ARASU|nr:Protein kinase domain [Arabidopsis suecica]